jgi:ribosomal 50S subunit-recycling heat shock protein
MNKNLLKKIGHLVLCSSLLAFFSAEAQTVGEFRTRTTYNTSYTSTSGWQIFDAALGWINTGSVPATGSIATIRDGVVMTSNSNATLASILNVGEGNAASITSSIDGSGTVTGLTIANAGSLSSKPNTSTTVHSGLVFVSSTPATIPTTYPTPATAIITSYTVTGIAINFGGSGYTNATTVTFDAPALLSLQTASASPLVTATGTPIITGGVITGITITNPGSGYTNIPAITITDTGGGTGATFSAQLGVQEVVITAGGVGYTAAPEVIAGSSFQVGGSSSRTVIIENQLNFRAGAKSVTNNSGATSQTLSLGGNLTVVTPISFRTVSTTFTGNTNVTFNKNRTTGNASINGGNITFNNLSIGASTTVDKFATITVLGTTNLNSTGVLPVGLTSFTAKNETDKVRVSWTTSSESDNDKFEVLKSTDGVNFTKIASVKAKGPSTYTVDDYYPFKGTNYYKLLQYDLSGKVNDEGVRFANFSFSANEISSSVYPNPLKSSTPIFVKFKKGLGNFKLTMYATDGKIIYEESVDNPGYAGYELKLKRELNPGLYFLNINSGNTNERLKVVVQ